LSNVAGNVATETSATC